MSIVRTPIVDDDGTGQTGTLINAAWKDEFYDQIDDAIAASPGSPVEQTTTATGAQNNFNLTGNFTFLRCTGAAPVFSGFTVNGGAPSAGDRLIIECLGTTARVTHQDVNSTAANRIITASTNGQIVGANGRISLVYDGTTDRWRAVAVDPGAPINVAHAAGNFTASGSMTWTVEAADQITFTYRQSGKFLYLTLNTNATSIGGTPSTELYTALPAGFVCTRSFLIPTIGVNNGVLAHIYINPVAGGTVLRFYLFAGGNWTASTNNTNVLATCEFEVD